MELVVSIKQKVIVWDSKTTDKAMYFLANTAPSGNLMAQTTKWAGQLANQGIIYQVVKKRISVE